MISSKAKQQKEEKRLKAAFLFRERRKKTMEQKTIGALLSFHNTDSRCKVYNRLRCLLEDDFNLKGAEVCLLISYYVSSFLEEAGVDYGKEKEK